MATTTTTNGELTDCFEACRTCGTFYLTNSNILHQIFSASIVDPEMVLIRMELATWNIEIDKNDGFPQYICVGCIHEFQKVFKFRNSCVDIQQQLRHFYKLREENKIKIKTELPDVSEYNEKVCGFIYVDDLTDDDYDGSTVTPFNYPHMPIKEENIEEAAIPNETHAITGNEVQLTQEPEKAYQPIEALNPQQVQIYTDESKPVQVEKDFQCNLCWHISASQYEQREHMKRIHEIKDMECHVCGKQFKNSTTARLKFHLKWHKLNKHIKCAQCGFYCDSRATLKEHTRASHAKIQCKICSKFVTPKKIKLHMREHVHGMEWECLQCTEVFDTKEAHELHIWQVHSKEENAAQKTDLDQSQNLTAYSILCAKCEQKFQKREDLEKHLPNCVIQIQNTMPTENEIAKQEQSVIAYSILCAKCEQKFQSREDLEKHLSECMLQNYKMISTENDTAAQEHESQNSLADVNYESFLYSDEVVFYDNDDQEHNKILDINESNTAITTENDDYTAVVNDIDSEYAIDDISVVPPNVNSFLCAQCTETFATVEQLCAHHKEHLKKSAFCCHICEKSFDLKFSLNRHLKKHNL